MSTTRGRLNVMVNAMRKPPEQVLARLEDFSFKDRYLETSDRVSLGLNSSKVSSKSNDPLVLNLLANVNKLPDSQLAILLGKTRADQLFYRDTNGDKVNIFILPISLLCRVNSTLLLQLVTCGIDLYIDAWCSNVRCRRERVVKAAW